MDSFTKDPTTGKHHTVENGLWVHYPTTCTTHDLDTQPIGLRSAGDLFWYAASPRGLVIVRYEREGKLTFVVQIGSNRVAWQRIEWPTDLDMKRDVDKVNEASQNFLLVAERESTAS